MKSLTRRRFIAAAGGAGVVAASIPARTADASPAMTVVGQDADGFIATVVRVEGRRLWVDGRGESLAAIDFGLSPTVGDRVFVGALPDDDFATIVALPVIAWEFARSLGPDLEVGDEFSLSEGGRVQITEVTDVPTFVRERLRNAGGQGARAWVGRLDSEQIDIVDSALGVR